MRHVSYPILLILMTVIGTNNGFASQNVGDRAELTSAISQVVEAWQFQRPAPIISAEGAFSFVQAYQIQSAAVQHQLQGSLPAGFKAGLTSTAAQKKFNVSSAVAGVLPPGSVMNIGDATAVVERSRFHRPMLEAELGFRFGQVIDKPLASVAELKALVMEVLPIVELPDLGFSNPQALTGIDIVANNVLAKQCLVGAAGKVPASMDVNTLEVRVWHDDELILTGLASDAMGDQWQALLWLVNHTLAQGYRIEPGQLLITGAIGRMLPLQAGRYRLEYGELGQLQFTAR